MARTGPWRTALLALGLSLLLALATPTPGADAQEGPVADPVRMRLEAIDGVVEDPTDTVSATLRLDAGPVDRDDLRLVVSVHGRVEDAAALEQSLAGATTQVYTSVSLALPAIRHGGSRLVEVTLDAAELELAADDLQGVYPLEMRVFEGGDPAAAVTTALVVLPPSGPAPLPATMVVEVTDDTALPSFDGLVDPTMEAAVGVDSPLVRLARELDQITDDGSAAGTSVVLSGRLAADVADMADGYQRRDGTTIGPDGRPARRAATVLDRLTGVLGRADTEALALPYGPADLVALVRGGEAEEARRLVAVGRQAVQDVLGVAPTRGIVVPPDGLDADTLAAIGPEQPDAVLLQEGYLTFADADQLEPVRRLRTADGGEVRMLVPDAGLSALLRDPDDAGLAAAVQHLRARTALQWLAADRGSSTGLLLQAPPADELAPGALAAFNAALGDSPWLRPVALGTMADLVRPSDRVVRLAYPPRSRAAELPAEYVAALAEARDALVPLRALLPSTNDLASSFGRSLLVAAATPYRQPAAQRTGLARIDEVREALGGLSAAVEVVEGPPVTITSAAGEIPVTLVNTATEPLSVRVALASSGFDFDEATRDLTLAPESAQTLTFRARALSAGGLSTVVVTVEDPSGQLELVTSLLSVRSTAVPVVAVVATIGGCAILLLWGLREGRRRRRPRRGRHEVDADEPAA